MRELCPHQLHLVSGGNGDWGFPNDCPYCNEDIDTAASNFANDYKDYTNRYNTIGFSDGAVIGGSIGAGVGGYFGGNWGSAIGGGTGQYVGRILEARPPYGSYLGVKEAAEKVYGMQ